MVTIAFSTSDAIDVLICKLAGDVTLLASNVAGPASTHGQRGTKCMS